MRSMLILGDSILWGQGLAEKDKCTVYLRDAWSRASGARVDEYRFAHSGADIWDDGQSGILAALNPSPPVFPAILPGDKAILWRRPSQPTPAERDAVGEIPADEAYLLRQILDARAALPGVAIDLVVVDMGINDNAVYDLVLPGKSKSAVVARARSLAPRVRFALDKIGANFPEARVLVSGYYPVVSSKSDLSKVVQFARRVVEAALQENVRVPWLSRLSTLPLLDVLTHEVLTLLNMDLADRCTAWRDAMHTVLGDAVKLFDAGRGVAAFVDPDFQPEHALFAPQSLLWPFVDGRPTDPKADDRRRWCDDTGTEGFERLRVESASLGHPSPEGAERYGRALVAHAQQLGLFVGTVAV
jgi:lysophospholipase L1-like esterase